MNSDCENVWNEAIVALFKILCHRFQGGTENRRKTSVRTVDL
jgi:hypothetical protein